MNKATATRQVNNVFTTKEAAKYLGLSMAGLRYHVRHGNIKPDRIAGGRLLFSRVTLDALNKNRRSPGRPPREVILNEWADTVSDRILAEAKADRKWVTGHSGRADGITQTYMQMIGKPHAMSWERFVALAYEVGAVLEEREVLVQEDRKLKNAERADQRRVSLAWLARYK